MSATTLLQRAPAPALVASGAISVQFGAAVATRLFSQVGPVGAVALRLAFAALVLLAVVRPRPSLLRSGRPDRFVVLAFGLLLGGMNLLFYSSIARVPLGVAVTVEFVGPLAVTIGGSRRALDVVWALLAAAGVFLLAGSGLVSGRHLDPAGIGMALGAGTCWAGYILLSAQTGRRFPGSSGLAFAMVVGAVAVLPAGVAVAGARLLRPAVLGLGVAVAVLSSALPYSLELAALRRLTPRAFGILASIDPALAALVGLAVLGQHLTLTELAALVLVAAANAGSSAVDARAGRPGSPPPEPGVRATANG